MQGIRYFIILNSKCIFYLTKFFLEKSNEALIEKCDNMSKILESTKKTLDSHTVILSRIAEKIFPAQKNINIFPIKSVEELLNIDEKLEKESAEDIVCFYNNFNM